MRRRAENVPGVNVDWDNELMHPSCGMMLLSSSKAGCKETAAAPSCDVREIMVCKALYLLGKSTQEGNKV